MTPEKISVEMFCTPDGKTHKTEQAAKEYWRFGRLSNLVAPFVYANRQCAWESHHLADFLISNKEKIIEYLQST